MQTWIEKTGALMKADQNKLLPKKESRKEQRLWSRLLGQIKVKTDKLTTVTGRDTAACTHRADWTHVKPGRKVKPEEEEEEEEAQNELCLCGSR